MFGLKLPVPMPMMIRPVIKVARESEGFVMIGGMADKTRMICPRMAIPRAMQMVLYRPR